MRLVSHVQKETLDVQVYCVHLGGVTTLITDYILLRTLHLLLR